MVVVVVGVVGDGSSGDSGGGGGVYVCREQEIIDLRCHVVP